MWVDQSPITLLNWEYVYQGIRRTSNWKVARDTHVVLKQKANLGKIISVDSPQCLMDGYFPRSFLKILANHCAQLCRYRLLLLNTGPHLKNTHGMGIIAIVINPSSDVAHANPRLLTICGTKRGNDDDTKNRKKVVAARTDAP